MTGVGESVAKALFAKQLVDRLAKDGVDGAEASAAAWGGGAFWGGSSIFFFVLVLHTIFF